MDKRAGLAIDFGSWCSWYSFDLTGLLSFQELFGFMEQAKDINGVIESSWSFMSYGTLVGQYPYFHKYLLGNPRLAARVAIDKYDENSTDLRGDFLEYLWQKQLKKPQTMTDRELINNILIFFVGAVNTNSASLRACFYYLVKTPTHTRNSSKRFKTRTPRVFSPKTYHLLKSALPPTESCLKAGVDTKGLYRVHEFTKVELFSWTTPELEAATEVFDEIVDMQVHILRELGLHCRVLEMHAEY
ncbi:Cytochrome p-450 [Pseudogymnoascus australis]